MKQFFNRWRVNNRRLAHKMRDLSSIGLIVILIFMGLNVFKHMLYFKAYASFLIAVEQGLCEGWFYFGRILFITLVLFITSLLVTYKDNWYGRGE